METSFPILYNTSKEIKQKTVIRAIFLVKNFVAVEQQNFVNDVLENTLEYITTKENLENARMVRSNIAEKAASVKKMPNLFKKEYTEVCRRKIFQDIDEKEYIIEKPFSYILEKQSLDNVILLHKKDSFIYDINNNPIPMAVFFNYVNTGLTNGNYKLRQVAYILKNRPDIIFENKKTKKSEKEFNYDQDIITEIPYFSADEDNTRTIIPFIWVPTNDDFKKYDEFRQNRENLDGYKHEFVNDNVFIINEILGLHVAKK